MELNLENANIIGVKNLNVEQLKLPILGIIVVTQENASLLNHTKVDSDENSLLSNEEVYQFIKHSKPKNKNALSCFMNRLRNLGLNWVKIDNSCKYKRKDLMTFLEKLKEY